jgi:hypothetical protein
VLRCCGGLLPRVVIRGDLVISELRWVTAILPRRLLGGNGQRLLVGPSRRAAAPSAVAPSWLGAAWLGQPPPPRRCRDEVDLTLRLAMLRFCMAGHVLGAAASDVWVAAVWESLRLDPVVAAMDAG